MLASSNKDRKISPILQLSSGNYCVLYESVDQKATEVGI